MSTQKLERIRLCEGDCERMTRPRNTPPLEDIHTVSRVDAKYCSPCYNKLSPDEQARRRRYARQSELERDVRLQSALNANNAFLEARRRRLANAPRRTGPLVNA